MTNAEAIEQLTGLREHLDRDILRLNFQRMKQTMRGQLTGFIRKEQEALDLAIEALRFVALNEDAFEEGRN